MLAQLQPSYSHNQCIVGMILMLGGTGMHWVRGDNCWPTLEYWRSPLFFDNQSQEAGWLLTIKR